MRLGFLIMVSSLSACRCGPALTHPEAADWVATPSPLVLPTAFVGQRVEAELSVDNLGGVKSTTLVTLEAPFEASVSTLTLGAAESARVIIAATPTSVGTTTGTLHLGELIVPVSVEARPVPACPATICSDAQFDLERGECVATPKADGTACDDFCVTGTCHAGTCEGVQNTCSDRDACTTDACGANGCIHVPLQCPSAGPCSAPACDANTGCITVEAPDGTLCGADDCRANTVEVCITGQCVTRPRPNEGRCVNTWVPATLSGRSHHALAWDETRDRVVLFGGYSSWGMMPETWEWNGSVWEIRTPTASPPASYRPQMAFDLARSRTVLVSPQLNHTSELWEWDGITWVIRATAAMSPATHGDPNYEMVGVAYDPAHRVTIVVVFHLGRAEPIETWEWDGTTLRQRTPATVPQIYYGAGHLTWDGTRQRVVLVGTSAPPMLARFDNAVWEWNGTDWTDRSAAASAIDSWDTFQAAPAWDADRHELVMKGTNRTTTFDGTTWSSQPVTGAEPIGNGSPMVYDTARHQLVLFDGSLTWTWDGTSWVKLTQEASPRLVALVTDTVRGRVLGFDIDQPPTFTLWQWDRRGWTRLNVGTSPPSRTDFGVAFDSARDRVVLVGGGETWEFDGTAWAKRLPAHQPSAREDAALAYDPIRRLVVLFGGHPSAGLAFGDAWSWDGTDWQQLSTMNGPSARWAAPMVWDSTSAHLVMLNAPFGGPSIEAWSWDGAWTQTIQPAPPAAPPYVRTLADDPVRHTIVAVQGVTFTTMATWEFSVASGWTLRTPTVSPGTGAFPMYGAAWDPTAQQVVLSGVGQTWLFLP